MTRSCINRPFKYGERDRREFIVQDSEISLVAINNTAGSPIYLGRAKAGVLLGDDKWQIRKITYDSVDGVIRVEWPQNSLGAASTEYEFVWSDLAPLTVTNITQANPATVTVSAIGTLQNGDLVVFQNVAGMTQVNFDGTNVYTVANILGNTFELLGIDSSAYGAYTGSGTAVSGNVLTLTYS